MAWWKISKPGHWLDGAFIEANEWFAARAVAECTVQCERGELQVLPVEPEGVPPAFRNRPSAGLPRLLGPIPPPAPKKQPPRKKKQKHGAPRKTDRARRHRR